MTHRIPVPVVDVSGDPDAVGAELDEICRTVGFFPVTGHGIAKGAAGGQLGVPLLRSHGRARRSRSPSSMAASGLAENGGIRAST